MTDPTLAGVTASFASLADVIIAEPGATVGFTGRRLIEQIVKQKLPSDAQSAEFMQEHGMVDLVTQRRALKDLVSRLIDLYTGTENSNLKQVSLERMNASHDHWHTDKTS